MATDVIRCGVIGVGRMGRHHARVYRDLPAVDLVGVYDADAERAREVAAERGTRPLSMDELLEAADVVSSYGERLQWAAAGHLSGENNTPSLAIEAMESRVGGRYAIHLAGRYAAAGPFEL